MKQSSSIYFNMGGLFYEGKGNFEIIVSGISSVGVCLLLLALLVFKLDIGKGPVTVGILVIYVLSCLAGGFWAGKILRQDKYRWGFLVGLCYFVLLAAVSFAVQRKWDMSFQHLVTTFFMCLGGGTLGGMLS